MKQEIERKVIDIIARQMGHDPAQITRDHRLVEDMGMDSLEVVEFTMRIEDTFALQIPDEEAPDLKTIGQVIDLIATRTTGRPD